MALPVVSAQVERFDGTSDFSMWTIRMMAHFGVSGFKEVITSDNFGITVPITKSDGKKSEDGEEEASSETKVIFDPVKLEKDERDRDMIIV